MLFCMSGDYTAHALKAMAESPGTDRLAAATKLIEAAGGKLVGFYARSATGPGVMVIYDVSDPEMSAAISGVVVAEDVLHNVSVTRLYTAEQMKSVRQKRMQLAAAYKAPGRT